MVFSVKENNTATLKPVMFDSMVLNPNDWLAPKATPVLRSVLITPTTPDLATSFIKAVHLLI